MRRQDGGDSLGTLWLSGSPSAPPLTEGRSAARPTAGERRAGPSPAARRGVWKGRECREREGTREHLGERVQPAVGDPLGLRWELHMFSQVDAGAL